MVDVIAIGCHPDDVEIGMGGTISRMVRTGVSVGIVDLSNGEPTPNGTREIRAREAAAAAEALGVDFRTTLDMKNRYIFDSVENRVKVAEVLREHRPKAVFVHYWDDYHPDHIQGSSICYAARFYGKFTKTDMKHEPYLVPRIYSFAAVHMRTAIKPSFITALDEEDVTRKMAALQCYESQFGKRPGDLFEYVGTMTRYYGTLVGANGGEMFASKEEIGISDIRSLL